MRPQVFKRVNAVSLSKENGKLNLVQPENFGLKASSKKHIFFLFNGSLRSDPLKSRLFWEIRLKSFIWNHSDEFLLYLLNHVLMLYALNISKDLPFAAYGWLNQSNGDLLECLLWSVISTLLLQWNEAVLFSTCLCWCSLVDTDILYWYNVMAVS